MWAEDRTADTYKVQWGEGISGSPLSNASLFADNSTYLVTGIAKTGLSDEITLYTTGAQTWPENENLILFGFPTGLSGINKRNTFYGANSNDYFGVRDPSVSGFAFMPTTGFMTYGRQKRTELVTADHTYTTYSGEVYDITRSGDSITGYHSGTFTGLNSGDSITLTGFFDGLITTGNFSGYAALNSGYIVEKAESNYFVLSGEGDNFITGEYTGGNGYLMYQDRSSYSGELVIAQEYSLRQSPFSDPQTSYIWRVRSENLYSQSDWTYGQFFTPNLPAAPTGAKILSPYYNQSGISSNLSRDNKLSVFVEWEKDNDAEYYNIEYGKAYWQYQPSPILHTDYSQSVGPITGTSGYLFLDYNTGYSLRIASFNYAGGATGATGLFFIQPESERIVTYFNLDESVEEELDTVLNEAEFQFAAGLISGYNREDLKRNVATGGNLNSYLYDGNPYSPAVTGFATGIE